MATQIIDISQFQTSVDASKLNADGVIIRLGFTGYGSKKPTLDTKFEEYYAKYEKAGVPIGIYYVSIATNRDMVIMETDWVLEKIKDKKLELPVWVDCEEDKHTNWDTLDKTLRSQLISEWCNIMQKAGYYTGIYASLNWFRNKFKSDLISNFDKWVAQYYSKCTYSEPYGMWQYTSSESASAHGITSGSNKLDASWCYRDYPSIIRGAGWNHLPDDIPEASGDGKDLDDYKYFEVLDGVNSYSKAKYGDMFFTIDGRVSNFQIREFACHDGTNEILIDGNLVRRLQDIRDKFGVTTITSAYRTPEWNKHEGGVPNSQHVLGKASDTVCKGTSPLEVAMYAEAIGLGGIGLYSSFTHIDTRDIKTRWDNRSGKEVGVSTFLKTIKLLSRGDEVRIAQKYLGVTVDGIFGPATRKATIAFQHDHRLDEDGIIGVQTWTKLLTR